MTSISITRRNQQSVFLVLVLTVSLMPLSTKTWAAHQVQRPISNGLIN